MCRLQLIDELTRRDHWYLAPEDTCYFYGEYTARRGYSFSSANQLITNLKKKMDRRGRPDWPWKARAIAEAAGIFRQGINPDFLSSATLVPMPPSKVRGSPEYDDRMLKVLQQIRSGLDVRELLTLRENILASHERDDRPSPDELYDLMQINENVCNPEPTNILLVDDVLTAGSHFVAGKRHLVERFPRAQVIGLFLVRRVPETDDFIDLDDL